MVLNAPVEAEFTPMAAPSITNTGDTNTGLYFSAADEVAVATGGAARMIIDSNSEISLSNNDSGTSTRCLAKVRDFRWTQGPTIMYLLVKVYLMQPWMMLNGM